MELLCCVLVVMLLLLLLCCVVQLCRPVVALCRSEWRCSIVILVAALMANCVFDFPFLIFGDVGSVLAFSFFGIILCCFKAALLLDASNYAASASAESWPHGQPTATFLCSIMLHLRSMLIAKFRRLDDFILLFNISMFRCFVGQCFAGLVLNA